MPAPSGLNRRPSEICGLRADLFAAPLSPFEVELTVNFDRKEPYVLGDGYGHLAVVVDDVNAEHARFEREKLSPGALRDFKHDGATLARFFFVSDPDGYKIEVIQKGGRFG